MKRFYFLLPAILFFLSSTGQPAATNVTAVSVGGFFPHFSIQLAPPADTASRLVYKVHSKYVNGVRRQIDSVRYSYNSNDRGGATKKEEPNNDENILFDESYTYVYNTVTNSFDNLLRRRQTFNADNKISTLLYSEWKAGQYADSTQYIYTYTGSLMTESDLKKYGGLQWSTVNLSLLNYDANKNVVYMDATSYKARFSYDQNNNIISVTDSMWKPAGGWNYNEKKIYTYNGKDVKTYTLQKWDAATNKWANSKYWEYTYSGQDLNVAVEHNWNGSGWVVAARNIYSYDNAHNKVYDVRQTWTGNIYVNLKRESWTYNSFNQPLFIFTETWSGSAWAKTNDDEEFRFEYAAYFPTSLKNVYSDHAVSVYPNPSSSNVNIDVNWPESQAFTACIYDMTGKVVIKWSENEQKAYHGSISVADLPAGTYFLKLAGDKHIASQKITVIK